MSTQISLMPGRAIYRFYPPHRHKQVMARIPRPHDPPRQQNHDPPHRHNSVIMRVFVAVSPPQSVMKPMLRILMNSIPLYKRSVAVWRIVSKKMLWIDRRASPRPTTVVAVWRIVSPLILEG